MPDQNDPQLPIAYFCMEFALQHDFHIYSGGLGILAGDFLLEAQQDNIPAIGIGLMYSSIFHQRLDDEGKVFDEVSPVIPEDLNFSLVKNQDGSILYLHIPFRDTQITFQAWRKTLGDKVSLILLDTKIPENPPEFQEITDKLYFGDKHHRFKQEMVLGIGGVKLLQALQQPTRIIHMNEGHAALCGVELASQRMHQQQQTFSEAIESIKNHLVFSNHTLIPAGNDTFTQEVVTDFLLSYTNQENIPLDEILRLGNMPEMDLFSMTYLALRTAKKTNAVSKLHAEKAKALWPDHPLLPITNGVFFPRWYNHEKMVEWPLTLPEPPNQLDFWHTHQEAKDHLMHFVKQRTGKTFSSHGLIVTWARRFVQYKRPEALLFSLDWLEDILKNSQVPVYIVFAGRGHPHDEQAREMVEHIVHIAQSERFEEHIAYLPDYKMETAEVLVQGSDVWLNTPVEGLEACGTSGMKAGLNGVLQCSTNDGWVWEVDWKDVGWLLDDQNISESIYKTLQNEIVPLFAKRDDRGMPIQWLNRMIKTAQIIRNQFSSKRMLEEYQEKLYK